MGDGIGKPNWTFSTTRVWTRTFGNCGANVEIGSDEETILDLRDCGTMVSTNFLATFQGNNVNKLYVDVNTADGTKTLDHRNAFTSTKLKELYVTGIWGGDLRSIVLNCTNLITVDFSGLDFSNIVTNNWNPLNGAVNVENLRWGKNYSVSMSFSQNTKLTVDSLMSVINNLPDLTGSTAQTLTLGSTNLAKLSASQVAIATNKNWNVV